MNKKELYKVAQKEKKLRCKKISKFSTKQLKQYIGTEVLQKNKDKIKNIAIPDELKKYMKEYRIANRKGTRDKKQVSQKFQANSQYSEEFFNWNIKHNHNKTLLLNSLKKARKLTNNELISLDILKILLDIPKNKQIHLAKMREVRKINKIWAQV